MNIFFLSRDPKQCAKWHDKKLGVKMVLEYTQLLYAVMWIHGLTLAMWKEACEQIGVKPLVNHKKHGKASWLPYGITHWSHPCVYWLCYERANIDWLISLLSELLTCFEQRPTYKGKPHMCKDHFMVLRHLFRDNGPLESVLPSRTSLTNPYLVMHFEARRGFGVHFKVKREKYEGSDDGNMTFSTSDQMICVSSSLDDAEAAYREYLNGYKPKLEYAPGTEPPWLRLEQQPLDPADFAAKTERQKDTKKNVDAIMKGTRKGVQLMKDSGFGETDSLDDIFTWACVMDTVLGGNAVTSLYLASDPTKFRTIPTYEFSKI